uniref:Uncharacterized protein n=1 Tax=Opuntia streptacantha TaxID=393608 RepID=A0A7C8ZTG5_OPUST
MATRKRCSNYLIMVSHWELSWSSRLRVLNTQELMSILWGLGVFSKQWNMERLRWKKVNLGPNSQMNPKHHWVLKKKFPTWMMGKALKFPLMMMFHLLTPLS